jgi:hypothetical protein
MNYLITESQSNIVRRELKRSIEEIGFWKTKKRFRLTMDQMDNLLSGEYFPELDCENIYDIIWSLFINGLVDRSYGTKNYKIVLSSDSMSGSIQFECTDLDRGDTIYGYATPYWEGECKIPLEVNWYSYQTDDEDSWEDNEIDSSDFFESVNLDIKFSSFSEIKDWFNTEYMKILLEYCHDAFDYVRYL